jgi:hypothetical protein
MDAPLKLAAKWANAINPSSPATAFASTSASREALDLRFNLSFGVSIRAIVKDSVNQ